MNFNVKNIWDLRSELTNALLSGNYKKITEIKNEYLTLVEKQKNNWVAFAGYNCAFWTNSERDSHTLANIYLILSNIKSYEERYVLGNSNVITKMKQPKHNFLAGEIWVLREMFDKFNYISKQECQNNHIKEENMILGKAIMDRLIELINNDRNSNCATELIAIIKDVREKYEELYGKEQPKISYSQIVKDYVSM